MRHIRLHRRTVAVALATAVTAGALVPLACSKGRDATAPYRVPAECSLAGPPASGSTQAYVAIRNFAFTPDTLRIAAGTTVTWVNCEPPTIDAHTTTAAGGQWDSGYLPPGSHFSRLFDRAGSFPYSCIPHPTMQGTIIVQ